MTIRRRLPVLILASSALTTLSAKEETTPPPKPIPVIFHACPSWCFPRGHSEQYRFCFDRPFAPGTEPDYEWQLRTMKEAVPDSALAIYCFINEKRKIEYWVEIFEKYLDAAARTGTKVYPAVHSVNKNRPQRADDIAGLVSALLSKFGENPNWFQWEGRPFIMDYDSSGLDVKTFSPTWEKIRETNRPFFLATEPMSNVAWAVKGDFSKDEVQEMLSQADGIYHFTQPLDQGLGGYKKLAEAIREVKPAKIYGAGIQPGYYSARTAQRNFISSRGTETLRKGFDAALAAKPDFLHVKTWNDWVEATSVEPSYSHTHALLDIISRFADQLGGSPFPASDQPGIVASYRKNAFPGEDLNIEILNLPVTPSFGPLGGKVTVRRADGTVLGEKTFKDLDGKSLAAVNLSFPIPAESGRDMLSVEVAATAKRSDETFQRVYKSLPPVPVVLDSGKADMVEFKVPLHRLNPKAEARLRVDGQTPTPGGELAAPRVRSLTVEVTDGPKVAGVAYLKDGFIINDPDPASAKAPMIDNWPSDPTYRGMSDGRDYYGALVAFEDGSIAYSDGAWVGDPSAQKIWSDYQFEEEDKYSRYKTGKLADAFRDLNGRFNGTLASTGTNKSKPKWKNIAPQFDILEFDGKGGVVTFPPDATPTGPMTVEILIRPVEKDREQEIFLQRGATISLRLKKDGKLAARRLDQDRAFREAVSESPVSTGNWHHITATYDMKNLRLYVDGKLAGETPATGLRSSENVLLGGPVGGGEVETLVDQSVPDSYFKGDIASFRILDGVPNPEQIATQARLALNVITQLTAKQVSANP